MNSHVVMGPVYKVHGDATVMMTVVTNLMKKDVLVMVQVFLNPLLISIPMVSYIHFTL